MINEKYIDQIYRKNNENVANNNVNAINFGISVLNWLDYGDKPNHKTFICELQNNKYSTLSKNSLERYVVRGFKAEPEWLWAAVYIWELFKPDTSVVNY